MKINFSEWQHGAELFLQPETMEQLNELARFALNAKKEAPMIYLRLTDDGKPYLSIIFRKRADIFQTNTIKPYKT